MLPENIIIFLEHNTFPRSTLYALERSVGGRVLAVGKVPHPGKAELCTVQSIALSKVDKQQLIMAISRCFGAKSTILLEFDFIC